MSVATLTNTCQACGAEESLDGLLMRMIDDDQVRRLIADVVTASLPLGGLVVRYLRLHKPARQKLRMDKVARLLGELVPDMQRAAIERNGRTWAVGGDAWRAALQAVFDAQAKGTLALPLEGNGYLYGALMRMADRSEGQDEKQQERALRGRAHSKGASALGEVLEAAQALTADMQAFNAAHGVAPVSVPAPSAVRRILDEYQAATGPRVPSPTVRAMRATAAAKAATVATPTTDSSTEERTSP